MTAMKKKILILIAAGALIASTVGIQSAGAVPIVDVPGLVSITIWEDTRVLLTDPLNEVIFPIADDRLSTRLATLDAANHDFAVFGSGFRTGFNEFYDFFFSDADGTPDPLGAFLTIEVRYDPPGSRGPGSSNGGNISEVALNFLDGREFVNSVASFVVLGPGDASTVGNAVDGDLNTTTLLGNTLGSDQRLRLTVWFTSTAVPLLGHFKCYKAKGDSVNVNVTLQDQFEADPRVRVSKPKLFCNPVDKNGEGIQDPTAHLTCYEIEHHHSAKRVVSVENQFGEQTLRVKKSELLCVPSKKLAVTVVPENNDDDEEDERKSNRR